MPREFSRHQRVADFIKREVAQILQLEMRDPRLGMVSVTAVDVSRDLALAKIYVTFLENANLAKAKPNQENEKNAGSDSDASGKHDQQDIDETIEVLNKASGFIRSRLARELTMRSTPSLRFYFDASVSRGQQLSSLIDKAVAADKALHHEDDSQHGDN